MPAPTPESIHDLFRRVREHPDFVFGTIFVRADFDDSVPADFVARRAEDQLAELGSQMIDDVA